MDVPKLMRPAWIQVATGRRFWPLAPRPEDIDFRDIAHALSMQCRFSGHSRAFYSVAQHSVLVSHACDPQDALWGLMHDASEAYLVDIPKPLKIDVGFTSYRAAEDKLQVMLCVKFGLQTWMPSSVHRADEALLAAEAIDLMSPLDPDWEKWVGGIERYPETIHPWGPERSKSTFLARFHQLTKGRFRA
jgi:5'-deoxynucleotidase YfbR-like HD superfamily hydrolase